MIVCRKRGGFRTRKNTIHQIFALSIKASTFGITRCDHVWPNLQLEVAEGFALGDGCLAAQQKQKQLEREGLGEDRTFGPHLTLNLPTQPPPLKKETAKIVVLVENPFLLTSSLLA